MAGIYEALGFQSSPFFRESLQPTKEDNKKFQGRLEDVRNFLRTVSGSAGVHLVTGMRGVGKTSFVNTMQYLTSTEDGKKILERHKINFFPEQMMPCYKAIQLEEKDSSTSVLLRTISSLIFSATQEIKLNPKYEGKQTPNISEIKSRFEALTHESLARAEAMIDTTTKSLFLEDTIRAIRKDLECQSLYLTVDNLDILEIRTIAKILNELRDYLFVDGLTIILLGLEGLYLDLRSNQDGLRIIDRISGQETTLKPLSKEEVLQILDVRRRLLAANPKDVPELPLSSEFIGKIYDLVKGQIRLLFKICDLITVSVLCDYPSIKKMADADADNHLKSVVEREVNFSNYSKKQLELLAKCIESPMRPKQYKELKLESNINFVQLAERLVREDLLGKRADGIAVYYEPTGLLTLARHCDLI